MTTLAIVVVALASVAGTVTATIVLSRQAERGWLRAEETSRSVRERQTARITTLENRLLARSPAEFADLQTVPDEGAKTSWVESQRVPESFGIREEEIQASRFRDEGADLEGDVFAGPTVG